MSAFVLVNNLPDNDAVFSLIKPELLVNFIGK